MGARVAVAGASGYAGGELLRLIAGHPDLELAAVTADSNAGRLVGEVHPNLAGLRSLAGRRFDAATAGGALDCDLAFLALPPGQSPLFADHLRDGVKIVDLGADYRLADAAAWARHYGTAHLGRWPCGLPELPQARDQILAAERVAVPGCYATASILALAPLLAAGLIEPADIVIVAASGTSGAGRVLRSDLLGSEVMGSVAGYQAGGAHRHTPEIEQALEAARQPAAVRSAASVTVSFTPMLAPMPRGILATCTARLTPGPALRRRAARQPARRCSARRWPALTRASRSSAFFLMAAGLPRPRSPGRTACTCRLPPTPVPGAPRCWPPSTTSARALPVRRCR